MPNPQIRVPFLLIQPRRGFSRRLRQLSTNILSFLPSTRYDLAQLFENIDPEDYVGAALFSAMIAGSFFAIMLFIITLARPAYDPFLNVILGGVGIFAIFSFYMIYPGILLKKIGQETDNDLIFALRELALQIESGVTLYEGMTNIAGENYGYVSRAFATVVREINTGVTEKKALQRMALRSESEYLKKIVWQILTAIESGAPLASTLRSVVDGLMVERYRMVKEYSSGLNFLILMYMLIAAAIPSIGMTFMILLSTFSGLGLTPEVYVLVIIGSFIGQASLIGYISVTRPNI